MNYSLSELSNLIIDDSSLSSTFKWKIKDYDTVCQQYKVGEKKESPKFVLPHNTQMIWSLIFYPQGLSEPFKDFAALFLKYHGERIILTKYNLCILAGENRRASIFNQSTPMSFNSLEELGQPCFVKRDRIMNEAGMLNNNTLTIGCQIILNIKDWHCEMHDRFHTGNMSNRFENLEDFEDFLDKKKFSDVKFVVGKSEIYAHKIILSFNSRVFKAMFDYNTSENRLNRIEISDINYDVLKEMLRFMYTGKVSKNISADVSKELMCAADKYGVNGLRNLCEKHLCQNLNVNNVIEYYNLALMRKIDFLKFRTKRYMLENKAAMANQPGYEQIAHLIN